MDESAVLREHVRQSSGVEALAPNKGAAVVRAGEPIPVPRRSMSGR